MLPNLVQVTVTIITTATVATATALSFALYIHSNYTEIVIELEYLNSMPFLFYYILLQCFGPHRILNIALVE